MIHKKTAFALAAIVLAAVSTPLHSKDTVVESIWAALPLTIDGVTQDWDDATPITDKASRAQYALKNDGKNLYIVMILRDDIARSTIAFTGMKIYGAVGDKKNKDEGILFMQKQLTPDELIASLENKGEAMTEERKAELRKQKSYTVFLEEAIVPKQGAAQSGESEKPEPAQFRTTRNGQVSVYEFKIPLSRIGQAGGVQPGSAVKVGFEWGGMTKEIRKNVMADRAASGAVARGGAVSSDSGFSDQSGEGGFEGPDFSFSRDPRYKKYAFWIDVKLAAKGS